MNPSRPFILRPVATALLMVALFLAGGVAFFQIPVSALPEVDYPTIQVLTFYPGASPDDAAAVQGFAAQLGFRLPNFIVSPFARRHYVSHTPMDHTAVIKFVENRFIGSSAHLTARDAAQPELPMVASTVAHVAVGALLLATTVVLAIQVWRHVPVSFAERVPEAQHDASAA